MSDALHGIDRDSVGSTLAVGIAVKIPGRLTRTVIDSLVDDIVLVTDEDMRKAAQWLWFEMGVGAELSGAASLAALQAGKLAASKVDLPDDALIATIACGSGSDGIDLPS